MVAFSNGAAIFNERHRHEHTSVKLNGNYRHRELQT